VTVAGQQGQVAAFTVCPIAKLTAHTVGVHLNVRTNQPLLALKAFDLIWHKGLNSRFAHFSAGSQDSR